MADLTREIHDERRNLRPVILTLCFIWGMLLGFALNFTRSDPPEDAAAAQSAQVLAALPPPEPVATEAQIAVNRTEGLPAITPVEKTPPLTTIEPAVQSTDLLDADKPPVQMSVEYGLNGRTAAPPKKGLAPVKAPTPEAAPVILDLSPF